MSSNSKSKVIAKKSKEDEMVMVVSRNDLFASEIWNGINGENTKKYISLIYKNHKFMRRGDAEEDPKWKQIIPYMIYVNNGKIFLMKRRKEHTDRRLASMYSLGIGGHINREDIRGKDILDWAKREFAEEIDYQGSYKTEILGVLNHDANDVGLVHVGLIIKLEGDANGISVRDEHLSGELVDFNIAGKRYKQMETWSQIVYDFLMTKKGKTESEKAVSGVLPDWMIESYIDDGAITIEPLSDSWREQIDQVSIDFHLGTNLKLFKSGAYRFVDTKRGLPADAMEEVILLDGDPFILEPGAFAIASTSEVLKLPKDILGRLEGKSSLARLGILVHSTAARFDPGWNGAPVLELGNLGPKPAILYAGMPICAFTFEKLAAPVRMSYEGSRSDRYSGSKDAVASRIERHDKKR